jgi:hypothetical protein
MKRTALALLTATLASPAMAGDYIEYDCKPQLVFLSIPAKGEIGFFEYTLNKDGTFTIGKELPKNLFVIKDNGRKLYYRGKLCSELE